MSKLGRAGTTALVLLSILLVCAARHPARSQEPAARAAEAADCKRSTFRVVVDVGHTLEHPGAVSARGVDEYVFNLHLANEIQQALVDAGFEKTVRLVTTTNQLPGLAERATRANSMHADLFISIHHDSVPDKLLETWEYEGQQRPFSDRFKGYAIFISNENGDRKGSLEFGRFLGKELQTRGLHYTPHYILPLMGSRRRELVDGKAGVYRFDQLVVLRKTLMPAVLLEAGSIINRDEELEMAAPERRALTSAAVAAAVEDFCAARPRPVGDRRMKRLPHPDAALPPRRNKATSSAP
jgi:N-acetylmuramoyl-L-alanine amidase